jgi:hypothetical protein
MKTFLRWLTGWCEFHDVPLPPLKVAELEQAAGINPHAVAELRATTPGTPSHYDPELIDCRNRRCRRRRGLAPRAAPPPRCWAA